MLPKKGNATQEDEDSQRETVYDSYMILQNWFKKLACNNSQPPN